MNTRIASLVAACTLLAVGAGRAAGGGIHIQYRSDAPEKLAAADVAYYHGVLNLYHHHPVAFAAEHPFYVKLFNDPVRLDKLMARWEADPPRFEFWHDCLWKVLNGYRHSHQGVSGHLGSGSLGALQLNPSGSGGAAALGGLISSGIGPLGNGSGGQGNGNRDGNGSGGGGITSQGVPEPSSVLLMGSGLLIVGTCFACRCH